LVSPKPSGSKVTKHGPLTSTPEVKKGTRVETTSRRTTESDKSVNLSVSEDAEAVALFGQESDEDGENVKKGKYTKTKSDLELFEESFKKGCREFRFVTPQVHFDGNIYKFSDIIRGLISFVPSDGPSEDLRAENYHLKAEIAALKAKLYDLTKEVAQKRKRDEGAKSAYRFK
jgi:hypothetical protein